MAELDDKVIVTKNKITTIADTIREEGGTSDLMTLDEMPDNIRAIAGGGSADVKRLGITLANNTATFNLNGYEIWQLIGSNKTIVADITYTDGNNSTSYNKSCTASLKSEVSDTQTRIEASVMIYKNYTFYTRYFNMVIGASSMEYTGTYAVTDVVIPEEQYVDPLFTLTYPSTITCNKTFAQISSYYGAGNTKPVAPQLIYKYSSGDDTAFRSVYGEVEQYDEDTFIFTFNMGYARGVGKTQWQEKIVEIQYERGDSLSKIDDYILEYQKPIVEGDGINITTQGTGINRKSKISVDSSMIMIGNASGSVASIVDGADDTAMKSCMVAIEPVQSGSGDPSPSNVRTISGWSACNLMRTGKNLVPDELTSGESNGVTITLASDGTITLNGTCTGSTNFYVTNSVFLKGGVTYSLCDNASGTFPSNSSARLQLYQANVIDIQSNNDSPSSFIKTGTALKDSTTVGLRIRLNNGFNYQNCKLKPMLVTGTATDLTQYEQGTSTTYNIEFPSEAGTVYGGTLDVTNGVLIVDRAIVDGGDLTWNYWTDDNFYAIKNDKTAKSISDILCDCYPIGNTSTKGIYCSLATDTTKTYIYINDSQYSHDSAGASQLKSDMTGHKICYRLATPTTYNLTPTEVKTLLGSNNIFADTGDVLNAEYTRDASIIINEILERVIALEQGA